MCPAAAERIGVKQYHSEVNKICQSKDHVWSWLSYFPLLIAIVSMCLLKQPRTNVPGSDKEMNLS